MKDANWILTYTGRQYWPCSPVVDHIHEDDIAHHLSLCCRFVGASTEFYSVAEHSIHVAELVPPEHKLTALLHDAPEAYLGDMSKPAKNQLGDYRRAEALNWAAICQKFGVPYELPECVKQADYVMLHVEKRILLPHWRKHPGYGWGGEEPPIPGDVTIYCWPPTEAERHFSNMLRHLLVERENRRSPQLGSRKD